MSWNIVSLILACAMGWAQLFVGYQPVSVQRRLSSEPLKAAGA